MRHTNKPYLLFLGIAFIVTLPSGSGAQAPSIPSSGSVRTDGIHSSDILSTLRDRFRTPPQDARPRVWWHWMNGNISEEGIRLDLEWMHRAGIGGYQLFDAARTTPQIVQKRVVYMTPAWKDALKEATHLAQQYGMEQGIAASPGWSETGGPWVRPADAMKKYVWSETVVEGGRPFSGVLVLPPKTTGPFLDRPKAPPLLAANVLSQTPVWYSDSVVIAFRQPSDEIKQEEPVISSSDPQFDSTVTHDGMLSSSAKLNIPDAGEKAWIQYDYAKPVTLRAISLATTEPLPLMTWLYNLPTSLIECEVSEDGRMWRKLQALPSGGVPQVTVTVPATTTQHVRITFRSQPAGHPTGFAATFDPAVYGYPAPPKRANFEINELILHQEDRIDHFEAKAGFVVGVPHVVARLDGTTRPIAKEDVVDLTSRMQSDGTLVWTPPPGRWTVLRFGYSLLGTTNNPAEPEATGLEVDKLDAQAVRGYINTYLDSYNKVLGSAFGSKGLAYLVNDSWESGPENWTPEMLQQFQKRRGYDARPWLPVLTGRIVESGAASERFLWDFRATIGDLLVEEHYGVLQQALKSRGVGQYVESHESGRALNADGMEVKRYGQVPMGAKWARDPNATSPAFNYIADGRETASVSHLYGLKYAAAESFTASDAPYSWSPATLKKTADLEFLTGINRIMIHSSVHQPLLNSKPGITLGPFGQWFNRNETWAEQARPWTDYLARSSYLLQQGTYVADVLSFYGENTNITEVYANHAPDIPRGYSFDYVNADVIMHRLKVDQHGFMVASGGAHYKILDLGTFSEHLTLPLLKSIKRLVIQGATVVGSKPQQSPSLADDTGVFAGLSNELFGNGKGAHRIGKGTVYAGESLARVLASMNVPEDFALAATPDANDVGYLHRHLESAEIYFVSNQGARPVDIDATFRTAGHVPELWHADTGRMDSVTYHVQDGRTQIALHLEQSGSVFVVFGRLSAKSSQQIAPSIIHPLGRIEGDWDLEFPGGWGAPAKIEFPKLISWVESGENGVKYFSGTATYHKTIQVPDSWFVPGSRILIDLGDVKNLASVRLNGHSIGTVWHAPFQLDVTAALKAGLNDLHIEVTNSWVNRLIGDEQPGIGRRYTSTTYRPYSSTSRLLPSGLLGPVTFLRSSDR